MSAKKILVIDDSATIRRLVDRSLGAAGYHVTLAPTAEDGVRLVPEVRPDMILLDHQLPGTTGTEVCRQLLEIPEICETPVVVSSTLRNKAYAEYTDLPNVVDMLPKPYAADLLAMTVANALDTGSLVVQSQADGTAVPEVIQQLDEPDFSGTLKKLGLRDVIDFLTCAGQSGVLEVEGERQRVLFHMNEGRISGVSANGIDAAELEPYLPESLQSLAPMLALTIDGRANRELDGVLELLDRKVLDPRLLRKLLRYQAALLTMRCFTGQPREFRFAATSSSLPLQQKLPLEVSLLALLVDAALVCDEGELPPHGDTQVFGRAAIRGQNLDRAGVSARHLKLLNLLSTPSRAADLAAAAGWDIDETLRVLHGMTLAGLVEAKSAGAARQIIVFQPDAERAKSLREFFASGQAECCGKVVGDALALQLVLKRARPDVIAFDLDGPIAAAVIRRAYQANEKMLDCIWIAFASSTDTDTASLGFMPDAVVQRPARPEEFLDAIDNTEENTSKELHGTMT